MKKEPKVLFFDIETLPVRVYTFQVGQKVSLNATSIVKGDFIDICTICYKWSHEKQVKSLVWSRGKSSKGMLKQFSSLVRKADIVIGHNADGFDIKHINSVIAIHKLPRIHWPMSTDTLKKVRNKFRFLSNRLDYLGNLLVGTGKNRMSDQDWYDIKEKNCQKALDKMVKYCKKDVQVLADVYDRIKPHIDPILNMSLYINGHKTGCPECGSEEVKNDGLFYMANSAKQRKKCNSCGHVFTVKLKKK